MTADDIKALIKRIRDTQSDCADSLNAADALESLSLENQCLRLEFRADCEKQAEELFAVQRDAERYRWLRDEANRSYVEFGVYGGAVVSAPSADHLDEEVDAARSQSDKEKL
jgi:hypothetical protein